jgi:ABC-2 type transport system permease protein
VLNEARLAWRIPLGLLFGLALPLLLLVIFGSLPAFSKPSKALGGLTYFNVYVPILIAFVIAALALFSLPSPLATYREQGILRRLSTTPVPPSWVLAAQVVINLCLAVIALFILVVVGIGAFGLNAPKSLGGFLLAIVLSIAALFAMGLLIAAIARTGQGAAAIGSASFFPLMFFAGLWVPRAEMPAVLRDISDLTPLGASVRAIQNSMQGTFPSVASLLVLAGYAVVFGFLAVRFFRWE